MLPHPRCYEKISFVSEDGVECETTTRIFESLAFEQKREDRARDVETEDTMYVCTSTPRHVTKETSLYIVRVCVAVAAARHVLHLSCFPSSRSHTPGAPGLRRGRRAEIGIAVATRDATTTADICSLQ